MYEVPPSASNAAPPGRIAYHIVCAASDPAVSGIGHYAVREASADRGVIRIIPDFIITPTTDDAGAEIIPKEVFKTSGYDVATVVVARRAPDCILVPASDH